VLAASGIQVAVVDRHRPWRGARPSHKKKGRSWLKQAFKPSGVQGAPRGTIFMETMGIMVPRSTSDSLGLSCGARHDQVDWAGGTDTSRKADGTPDGAHGCRTSPRITLGDAACECGHLTIATANKPLVTPLGHHIGDRNVEPDDVLLVATEGLLPLNRFSTNIPGGGGAQRLDTKGGPSKLCR